MTIRVMGIPWKALQCRALSAGTGVLAALTFAASGCAPAETDSELVEFVIPAGASFAEVTDTLAARELVGSPLLFRGFARIRGDDRGVRAGRYRVPAQEGWGELLDRLVAGRVVTEAVTIPEGYTIRQLAPRIAPIVGMQEDDIVTLLEDEAAAEAWEVPGPGLEGYLFPETYRFAEGVGLHSVISAMVDRYRSFWTEERKARAEELGLTEREVATLASIVQAQARRVEEMRTISGVFHNRLQRGYLLQADPTVQYALGERRSRLLYADIDAVADHPYNTYTQPGLPPGPIGAPGDLALEAALEPADVDYLYFVARPDGSHIFTRTLQEHNRARVEARRLWDALDTVTEGE